eukprot:256920-Rhodomonas_salina.1
MTMRRKILAVCALACHVFMAAAFSPAVPLLSSSITERSVQGRVRQACSPTMQAVSEGEQHINRRNFLQGIALTGVVSTFPVAAFADADDDRIKAGYDTLVDLLDNWGKYAGEGKEAVNGDNVRRQIGTEPSVQHPQGASAKGGELRLRLIPALLDICLNSSRDDVTVTCDRDRSSAVLSRSRRSTHRSKPTPTPRSSQVPATEEGHSRLCSSKRLCRRRCAICSFAAQQNDCTSRLPLRNLSESELQLTHLIRVEASAHARVFLVGSRLLNVPQARIPGSLETSSTHSLCDVWC